MKRIVSNAMAQESTWPSTSRPGALDDWARRDTLACGSQTQSVKASKSAFTLIELLVVIAIIAILAAMLLPVLNRAKMRGQMVYDLNNFKQLQLCWHMYVLDNNDYLPLNFVNSGGALSNSWVVGDAQTDKDTLNIQHGVLFQYNQQVKIYACPANTIMVTAPATLPTHPQPYKVPQVRTCSIEYSVGGNSSTAIPQTLGPWTITRSGYTWNSYQKFSQIQTTRIAQKIVFADEAQWSLDDGALAMFPMESPLINQWWNLPCNRHNNGTVWSFADGHCEYWKWHGSVINTLQYQTTYYNGSGTVVLGDTSDDLPRTEAGAAQYP
jgi:prepilin-type N-terminal cleavage/methylation domain-containing protein/prepilin-type processing-associated H-X9-DG protein